MLSSFRQAASVARTWFRDGNRASFKSSSHRVRQACGALHFDPSSYHYKSCRTGQASLVLRIREIYQTRVRYGYRRIHVLLRREGWRVNIKKTRRIYNEMGFPLRNKHPKRRVNDLLPHDHNGVGAFDATLARSSFP
ncbi:transposase [Paracoccus subflavus]|uniref:Transposase n=1 Tax=Paracoccus subflavus TaxID=2528244 RepID=A0A4Q9FZ33_9RHOB|nr:transposase [Paracoccus subflavus]